MKNFLLISISIIVLTACQNVKQQDNCTFTPDIKIFRYDRLQYEASALNSVSAQQKMRLDWPRATKILIEDVLGLGLVDEPTINERLYTYFSDTLLLRLMEDAQVKYNTMAPIEERLSDGFRYLKREIPEMVIPSVYTQISALNQSIVVGDSLIGISIDKYMGEDYPLYRRYYYSYQRRSMKPERILPDCFTFYLLSLYPFEWLPEHRSLFDIMMHQGKINWIVKHVLDMESDAEVLDYTPEEIEWCESHRKKIWTWMKEHGHLDSMDPMIIRAYTYPAPSIIFEGKKVPPLLGVWIGMQLTEMYMKQHPGMSIRELLECTTFEGVSLK